MTLPANITTGTWSLDNSHSEIAFTVRHAGISKVRGQFKDAEATPSQAFISSIDLQPSDVGIFAILVILHNTYLHEKGPQSLAILATTHIIQRNVNPTLGLCKFQGRERDEIVVPCSCEESDASWRVGLIGFKVKIDANGADQNETAEVDVQMVRLRAIRPVGVNERSAP